MKRFTVSLLGFCSLLFGALPAHAQGYAPPVAAQATQQQGLLATSLTDRTVSYVTDAAGNITGFALSNGQVVLTANTTVPLGTVVRIDGFFDPSNPQVIYQATVYNASGAVLVQPSASYVVGGYYPAWRGNPARYFAPRRWMAPRPVAVAPVMVPRPVYAQPAPVVVAPRPFHAGFPAPWGMHHGGWGGFHGRR